MRIKCKVTNVVLEGDYGSVAGVCVICKLCDRATEVFGTSEASIRRGLVTLRNECPESRNNFYIHDKEMKRSRSG